MAQNALLPSILANAASLTEAANVERTKHTDSFCEESSQSLPSRYKFLSLSPCPHDVNVAHRCVSVS